jgi:hypothetical protein
MLNMHCKQLIRYSQYNNASIYTDLSEQIVWIVFSLLSPTVFKDQNRESWNHSRILV